MTNKEIFTQTLVENLASAKFIRELSQRCQIDYDKARSSSYDDDDILNIFNPYKFGQDRYFNTQASFVRSAVQSGLMYEIEHCPSNNYPIPFVRAGRLSFTYHYGKTRNEVTCQKTSAVRRQFSGINESIVQPNLYEKAEFNVDKLNEADHIYVNIIHGAGGNGLTFDKENRFLRVAVPYLKKTANGKHKIFYAENLNLLDILEVLEAQDASKEQAQPMVDTAIPKVKKIKRGA